jgi:Sulphur transport
MTLFPYLFALGLAATMGFAVQRGATCTVAAVDEVLTKRRAHRLLAMLEASVWVLGAVLLAQAMGGHTNLMPDGYAVSGWSMAGAALLGLGAAVNGACVFGTIARFGSGDWSYSLTPVGFYLGCLAARVPEIHPMAQRLRNPSPVLDAPLGVLVLIIAWMAWRVLWPLRSVKLATLWPTIHRKVWAPHAATLVIGVTFAGLLYLVGPWTYTESGHRI